MIRKLLLPAALVGLLGGCASAGYGYRDGYYYGSPSVEYRYHDYGYPYGYYPYRGYFHGYHGYPYYGRYYYPPYYYHHRRPRPPVTGTPQPPGNDDDDDRRPPWRDLNRRARIVDDDRGGLRAVPTNPQPVVRQDPRPQPRSRSGEGSSVGEALRRASEKRRSSSDTQEP